jgi:hypothetical protein
MKVDHGLARFNQVQALLVVRKVNEGPLDLFFRVLGLLHFENVTIKLLLERFIGVVDA